MTPLTYVAARPSGDFLAVASSTGWLGVWLPLDNRLVATHQLGAWINKVAWTADGAYLIATAADALHVFDGAGAQRLATIETGHGLRTFATHPTQPIAVTTGADGKVRLWDLASHSKIRELLADQATSRGSAIAMTERTIFVGYESGRFAACDHEDKWIASGQVFDADVSALAANEGSALLASGRGGMFRMDTIAEGWPTQESWKHPPKPIATNMIELAPSGAFVTALSDDTAVFYKSFADRFGNTLGTAFNLDRKPWEQTFIVSAACFVRPSLVATSHFGGYVKLWRLQGYGRATVRFDDEPRWEGVDDPVKAWSDLV